MDDQALLAEVGRRLSGRPPIVRVVAFGSRTRATARPDSDLDLVVVMERRASLAERAREIWRHLGDVGVPVDLVIYTPEEYQRLRRFRTTVAGIADREGHVLVG